MQGICVSFRIDRDGAQAHPLCGASNAAGDLAAIGDEDGFEHGARIRGPDTSVLAGVALEPVGGLGAPVGFCPSFLRPHWHLLRSAAPFACAASASLNL